MRVITYNIQYGKGRDGRYDLDRIADVLTGADIIALQEIEACWDRSGNIHQVEFLAERLDSYAVYGPTIDIHKSIRRSDGSVNHCRRQFGNAVLCRWPIIATRRFLFPKLCPLNAHSIQRGIIEATIDTPLGLLRIYSTHLSHLCDEERLDHAEFLLAVHRRAKTEGPVSSGDHPDQTWLEDPPPEVPDEAILMGDLNLQPHSPVYPRLVGGISHMYGRLNPADGFVDAWVAAGHDEHTGHTAYSNWEEKSGKRIDYVLVTPALKGSIAAAEVLTEAVGSDHQPLAVTFRDKRA